MQRGWTIVLGVAVAALAVVLAMKSVTPATSAPAVSSLVDAGTDAAQDVAADAAATRASLEDEAFQALLAGADLDDGGGVDAGPLHYADGTVIPPLDPKAPARVKFGVVLVTYDGAQGAPSHARSKKEALALAQKLEGDAKSDFGSAVKQGDDGSSGDMGAIERGVLEPAPEAALFSLAPGATSNVVDTPRGYWIVKRLE